ncbi:MAG: DUF4124 domain-containing protein [Pseudomonadales bacterium]|nr:DUF4124 domain-containing protein [Pseudomonadales bacterium]
MKVLHLSALLLAIACIYSSSSIASAFYKWVDEKGVTHYSQNKPINQQSEALSTKTQGKKSPNYIPFSDEAKAAELAQQQEENKPAKKQATKKPEQTVAIKESKPVKQEIKRDKGTCERAKKNEIALRNTPIVRQGGKILTLEEKNQQLADIMEIKKIHCK